MREKSYDKSHEGVTKFTRRKCSTATVLFQRTRDRRSIRFNNTKLPGAEGVRKCIA